MNEQKKQTALVPSEQSEANLPVPVKQTYWSRMSRAYKLISRALLVALPLFVVVFMALCSRAFTYESVFCFLKDMQSAASFIPSDNQTVYYTYEEISGPVLSFRGGIAAVNGGGIEIYSPDGEKLFEQSSAMQAPRAVSSRKYLVAYEFGGTSFTVTNTYTSLYKGKTDYPIYTAAVDDTGQIALVTGAENHLSCVQVYNGNFDLIQRFNRASATVGVALSANGKYVAILGLQSTNGVAGTLVELYRIGAKEPVFVQHLEGEMPLFVDFTDNRNLAVLTDSALRVCNLDGKWRNEIDLDGVPVQIECNENGCVLALSTDALSAKVGVLVLDKKGNIRYDGELVGDVLAVSLGKRHAFLLTRGQVTDINVSEGTQAQYACGEGAEDLFALDDERLRVIYRGMAEYIYLNKEGK